MIPSQYNSSEDKNAALLHHKDLISNLHAGKEKSNTFSHREDFDKKLNKHFNSIQTIENTPIKKRPFELTTIHILLIVAIICYYTGHASILPILCLVFFIIWLFTQNQN